MQERLGSFYLICSKRNWISVYIQVLCLLNLRDKGRKSSSFLIPNLFLDPKIIVIFNFFFNLISQWDDVEIEYGCNC